MDKVHNKLQKNYCICKLQLKLAYEIARIVNNWRWMQQSSVSWQSQPPCETHFTGSAIHSRSSISCACWPTSVSMAWHPNTSLSCSLCFMIWICLSLSLSLSDFRSMLKTLLTVVVFLHHCMHLCGSFSYGITEMAVIVIIIIISWSR